MGCPLIFCCDKFNFWYILIIFRVVIFTANAYGEMLLCMHVEMIIDGPNLKDSIIFQIIDYKLLSISSHLISVL